MCIFNAVKQQSDIGFIADALFGYFAYLHNFYTMMMGFTHRAKYNASTNDPKCNRLLHLSNNSKPYIWT